MVDNKSATLEGLIPSSKLAKCKDKVYEDKSERFDVIKAREKYKAEPVVPWRLYFTQRTVTEPVVPQPEKFPMLACTLLQCFFFHSISLGTR